MPAEGASLISTNIKGLHTPSASIASRPSKPETVAAMAQMNSRKSVISAVSEFKQDSVDLDEQVPNARQAKHEKLENLIGVNKDLSGRKESAPPRSG